MSVSCCLSATWKALTEGNWVFSAGLIPLWQRALWHTGKWSVPGKSTARRGCCPSTPGTNTAEGQGTCPLCKYSPQGQGEASRLLGVCLEECVLNALSVPCHASLLMLPRVGNHSQRSRDKWALPGQPLSSSVNLLSQYGKHQQGSVWSLGDKKWGIPICESSKVSVLRTRVFSTWFHLWLLRGFLGNQGDCLCKKSCFGGKGSWICLSIAVLNQEWCLCHKNINYSQKTLIYIYIYKPSAADESLLSEVHTAGITGWINNAINCLHLVLFVNSLGHVICTCHQDKFAPNQLQTRTAFPTSLFMPMVSIWNLKYISLRKKSTIPNKSYFLSVKIAISQRSSDLSDWNRTMNNNI